MISCGTNADGEIVLRNHDNATALVLPVDDPFQLQCLIEMLVEELNERDEESAYILEEYDKEAVQ